MFIAHDLSVVRHISDRVAVMYLGQVVELADRNELYEKPAHPYTQLIALGGRRSPTPTPSGTGSASSSRATCPSPANPPSGCRFHTRCPIAQDICKVEVPQLFPVYENHWVACHFPCPPEDTLVGQVQKLGRDLRLVDARES